MPKSIAIVGPFQPAAIAALLPPEAAAQLAGMTNFAGVPVNWLAGMLTRSNMPTTVIGGVRNAEPKFIQSKPLSVAVCRGSGGLSFVLNVKRAERAQILGYLHEIKPELVHAHWTFESGRAAADWKGPKVLTVHDAAWEYARLGWSPNPVSMAFGARWLANTRSTLAGFRHLIAVSPYLEEYLRSRHRFRGEIRVIPNAIPDLPADLIAPETFPKTSKITFGVYGEPGRLKNIPSAIEAFRRLGKRFPDAQMVVFGSNWSKLQSALGPSEQVIFPGALPHREFMRMLVEEIDIWVHPSRIETHGIVICEAILAGCPVIAGKDSGAVPWTLDYGRAGLLVDVGRPEALYEAMLSMILDRNEAESTVTYGRQRIKSLFNPERIFDLHLEYYRQILACD